MGTMGRMDWLRRKNRMGTMGRIGFRNLGFNRVLSIFFNLLILLILYICVKPLRGDFWRRN
jgi:hypothetical protein